MEKIKVEEYKKSNSFFSFKKFNEEKERKDLLKKIFHLFDDNESLKKFSDYQKNIISLAISDLKKENKGSESFDLRENSLTEILSLETKDYLKYLFHRYRYEIFPLQNKIDEYPPCLQIEPSSICNFRCIFCFETDTSFTNKKNGFMGTMNLDFFKKLIDMAENNVEFVTLASRGEPLVSKKMCEMLEYTRNKFLNLKLNTNASLLNEKICHSILSDTVKTLVISADVADHEQYKKIRVNGDLSKVLKNLEKLNEIKEKHYKSSKIITRVSGVKFSTEQNFEEMIGLWNGLVDQVAYVDYNPWENVYITPSNNITKPCSDLWRRMFIWWDGKVNPCDVDYKSNLLIGSIEEKNLTKSWNSDEYNKLRSDHLKSKRQSIKPCKSCVLI